MQGDFVALVEQSGSGKSTLPRVVAALELPSLPHVCGSLCGIRDRIRDRAFAPKSLLFNAFSSHRRDGAADRKSERPPFLVGVQVI